MKDKTIDVIGWVGTILATTISWSVNKSILWALFQGALGGWIYVIYYVVMRTQ